jgi:pimeloyl-ACP methyl ester carboxylesterase
VVTHSYSALSAILYAVEHPGCVERLVLIGPPGPATEKVYPPELSCNDEVAVAFREAYTQLHSRRESMEPIQYCREAWKLMRMLYVAEPRDANRLGREACVIPNERGFMTHWVNNLFPSIRALQFTEETMSRLQVPVLVIHGKKDRSAPYGAGCEWAARLPDARLVTVSGAAHVPWVEAPELVFGTIDTFLRGRWPEAARPVDNFGQGGSVTT